MKILIISRDKNLQQALQLFFDCEADIQIVGILPGWTGVKRMVAQTYPDALLLDGCIKDASHANSYQAFHQLFPNVQTLVLANSDLWCRQSFCEADACVLKHQPPEAILEAYCSLVQYGCTTREGNYVEN